MDMAAALMAWGVRFGWRISWWALRQPLRLGLLAVKELAGAAAFMASYWIGLAIWFGFGLLAIVAAGWARTVGWLSPFAWGLSTVGTMFWLSLLVYLRTKAVRNNARNRAMMRRMFETTQQTAEKVEQVEQAVTATARRGPGVRDALRSAGTESERMTEQLRAEQDAKAREWTGGAVPNRPDPVVPVPRFARRLGEGVRRGWRKGGGR